MDKDGEFSDCENLGIGDDGKIKELQNKISMLEKERDVMKKERDDIKKDRDAIGSSKEALEQKQNALTSKLRDQVECPVCLEVPTSGPVHVCPNGHFVCSKCKRASCPTCRGRMGSGKSLLAVSVIENIEHKCRHEDCVELLPLEEFKVHLKSCPHRNVICPAPKEFCGKEMALSKVYDHILGQCKGSWNEPCKNLNNDIFPKTLTYPAVDVPNKSVKGFALCWNGVHFYLSVEKVPAYSVFSILLFGSDLECQDFEVNITVHRDDEKDMKGKHVQRFTGEPLPIDMAQEMRKQNGLMVGSRQMGKIAMKNVDGSSMMVGITIDIKKQ